jgi:hypothetical protein
MQLDDTEAPPAGAEVAWVCHGCHARGESPRECCPGALVARHDITHPCPDCALPDIDDEQ